MADSGLVNTAVATKIDIRPAGVHGTWRQMQQGGKKSSVSEQLGNGLDGLRTVATGDNREDGHRSAQLSSAEGNILDIDPFNSWPSSIKGPLTGEK